jgi:hypothetical protein
LINSTCSDVERDDSVSMDSFNLGLAHERVSFPDDNKGARSTESCIRHELPKQSLVNISTKPQEKTRLTKNPSQAMLEQPFPPFVEFVQNLPSNGIITPESSPEKPRYMVHKGSVHVASGDSPISCFWPSGTQRVFLDASPLSPGTGKLSGRQGPSGHRRNCSSSTTDSGLSCRSNPLLIAHDANNILPENASICPLRFPILPVSLSWLQSTTLEIMIDQEGFRMINPGFKLAGYAPPSTVESEAISLGAHLVSATADFMPLQRQSFAFHYSELDTPPVLRRLMLNGDGSHDYLSKQAYLILKANGPYTVRGTEHVQSSSLLLATEHTLSWRFDYFVGDRRTETGRIISGEKTFTPLSFSCSPALLLPTQGKKIRVMHVVKKSVATKLTAVKVEPPRPPSPSQGVPGAMLLSDAEPEFQGTVAGKYKISRLNAPQDMPALLHGTTGALPHLSESLQSPTGKFIEEKMDNGSL